MLTLPTLFRCLIGLPALVSSLLVAVVVVVATLAATALETILPQ